jgi:hypothetical protein
MRSAKGVWPGLREVVEDIWAIVDKEIGSLDADPAQDEFASTF